MFPLFCPRMNYFAHALPFLDRPYYAAGTAIPDWLSVVDRRVRVRRKHAEAFAAAPDPRVAAIAGGVLQHLRDDLRFHRRGRLLKRWSWLRPRTALGGDSGFRPSFLGHLLVEVLLDAALAERGLRQVEAYYQILESIDVDVIERTVNLMAPHGTERLAAMIVAFCRERILWDYLADDRLLRRLNQVMRRVGFSPLPEEFAELFPAARQLIDARREGLLEGIPVAG